MKKLDVLVTGTGRCGTVFMAKFLTSLGIKCGHESVFNLDGIDAAVSRLNGTLEINSSYTSGRKMNEDDSWEDSETNCVVDFTQIQADSSYMAAPYLNHEILKETKIIHIVRNPMDVVTSFVKGMNYFNDYPPENNFYYEKNIYNNFPEIRDVSKQLDRACLYYVLWNELIEKSSSFFHRIEDSKEEILNYLQINSDNIFSNTKENTFMKPNIQKFNFNDISHYFIKEKLKRISERYGYI